MNLGDVLKLIRTKLRMNQKAMAARLGISQNYLSLIESGKKTPSAEKINEMANALKVSKEALLFVSTNPPEELGEKDKEDFERLKMNITSLLVFEMNGEI